MNNYGTQRTIYTVSQVSRRIKDLIERQFADVWIEGEVSNLRTSDAGHIYFTLKDEHSQLPAVCFRSAALYLRFKPRSGETFRARGRLSIYEGRGEYQIIVDVLEPAGRGALQAAFEDLKQRLEREGLFDPARKRALPRFPSRIGIVTSPGSAALRDVLTVLERRHDAVDVVIFPTDVQGDRAAAGIAEGIRYLGQCDVDLVVLTRGGGPIEDLWPFNEEVVARAIAGSPKPVVSAVGHETDFTISDFVADLRAPTPSAAAEMIVRSKIELAERLDAAERRMTGAVRYRLSQLRRFLAERVGGGGFAVAGQQLRTLSQRVDDCAFRLERVARTGGLTADRRQKLDTLSTRAAHLLERIAVQARRRLAGREAGSHREMIRAMSDRRQRFIAAAETLDALSPLAVLDRGYAVCRTRDGQVVRSVGQVAPDSEVAILLHEGELEARVTAVMPGRERGGSAEGPGGTPRGRPGGEGEQG